MGCPLSADHLRMKMVSARWFLLLQVCYDLASSRLASSYEVHIWLLDQRGEYASYGFSDAACAADANDGWRCRDPRTKTRESYFDGGGRRHCSARILRLLVRYLLDRRLTESESEEPLPRMPPAMR